MTSSSPRKLGRSQPDIDAEASLWLAKKRMETPQEFDSVGFETWLVADPRHQAAYALMSRAANAATSINGLEPSRMSKPRPRSQPWRIIGPTIGLAAAAAVAFFVLAPTMLPTPAAIHSTKVAQVDQVTLPDGSRVTLGPASKISTSFSDGERRVKLTSGEAFFEVTHDSTRPFFVEAGDAVVRVVGTKFNVHRVGDEVRVSVAEGVVQVRPSNKLETVVLRAGDVADVRERRDVPSSAPPAKAVSISTLTTTPESAGRWREGRLAYIEAPLSELVADLNRYYVPGVQLADPALGDFKLTASFETSELETFFSTLPAVAPIKVTRGPNGEISLAPVR